MDMEYILEEHQVVILVPYEYIDGLVSVPIMTLTIMVTRIILIHLHMVLHLVNRVQLDKYQMMMEQLVSKY